MSTNPSHQSRPSSGQLAVQRFFGLLGSRPFADIRPRIDTIDALYALFTEQARRTKAKKRRLRNKQFATIVVDAFDTWGDFLERAFHGVVRYYPYDYHFRSDVYQAGFTHFCTALRHRGHLGYRPNFRPGLTGFQKFLTGVLYMVCQRAADNTWRQFKSSAPLPFLDYLKDPSVSNPPADSQMTDDYDAISRTLSTMAPLEQEVIRNDYLEPVPLTHQELAARFEVSDRTVRSRKRKALTFLAQQLSALQPDG